MKILLHTCCAPCLIYPLHALKKKKFKVSGFFYNPNIHPVSEYQKRRQAVVDLSNKHKLEVFYPEYLPSEFMIATEANKEVPERCGFCWRLRLEQTAEIALTKGFEGFTTTLLVSPYQDQELIKKIGKEIADKKGIYFYYEDFRTGFKKAHQEAKAKGIYCQNYCGCVYSNEARIYRTK